MATKQDRGIRENMIDMGFDRKKTRTEHVEPAGHGV